MLQKIPNLPYFDEEGDIDDYNENEKLEELEQSDEYDEDYNSKEPDYGEEEL